MKKVVALDIGGTNTRVALVDENYKILKQVINPTVTGDTNLFLENVAKTIDECVSDMSEVSCLAMGVPGRVRYDGFIAALPNIHISNIPLADYLTSRYKKPAYVINDAEVAALAEANLGEYKNEKSLYFITISTGVGGALTRNGRLVQTSYEVGHTMFEYKGEVHEFEHLTSGGGLIKMCQVNGLTVNNGKEFFDLMKKKDDLAIKVYRDWIVLLGKWIKMIGANFEPDIFTVTGGVMKSKDIFFEDLKKEVAPLHIVPCSFGQEAGLMGAAVLAFQHA